MHREISRTQLIVSKNNYKKKLLQLQNQTVIHKTDRLFANLLYMRIYIYLSVISVSIQNRYTNFQLNSLST